MSARPPRYAGFWIRFLADSLDGLIALAFALPFHFFLDRPVFGATRFIRPETWADLGLAYTVMWGMFLFNMTYLVSRTGKSFGRRVVGITVIDSDSRRFVGFWRTLARNLFAVFISAIFYLGFFWMIWDKRKQAWHDKLFKTLVVYDSAY